MVFVTLRFDDGTISQYEYAHRIMNFYDFPGSVFVIGKHLSENETKNYINLPRLKTMEEHGWEIGYHSYSHDRNWIEDPDVYQKETEIPTSLHDWRFKISNFALPHSNYNSQVLEYLKKSYRGIVGIPSNNLNTIECIPSYCLFRSFTITRHTKLQDIVNKIQEAIGNNSYLILLFHRIEKGPTNTWSFPLKRFQRLMKILSNYQEEDLIQVVTFNKALQELYGI